MLKRIGVALAAIALMLPLPSVRFNGMYLCEEVTRCEEEETTEDNQSRKGR
jgi:hypothetical protein